MNTQELVGYWLDHQQTRPPTAIVAKQGKAAKRLVEQYPRDQLVQACVGITVLFPHGAPRNEPWDLFDLERKFAKALAAAHNHPDAKHQSAVAQLEGIDLATYGRVA